MYKAKIGYLEHTFLSRFPNGFYNEEIKKSSKKHNIGKHVDYIHNVCSKENLRLGLSVYNDVIKVVLRSSMVSVFEKMRFRDLMREFDDMEKRLFLESVYQLLHGDEEEGFNDMVNLLLPFKLAKWPIITVWRAYYNIHEDVFVKPTTVKKILKYLEVDDFQYKPKVTYEFYKKYRVFLNSLKQYVEHPSLIISNPAFSGFFMISIES